MSPHGAMLNTADDRLCFAHAGPLFFLTSNAAPTEMLSLQRSNMNAGLEDLATANEKALHCARAWPNICTKFGDDGQRNQ